MSDVPTSEVLEVMQGLQIDLAKSKKEVDRLRLENSRLAAMVLSEREHAINLYHACDCAYGYLNDLTDYGIQDRHKAFPLVEKIRATLDSFKPLERQQSPSTALAEFVQPLQESLLECRDRLAAHDGCSRYQIGDSCIIERADKAINRLTSAIGGDK